LKESKQVRLKKEKKEEEQTKSSAHSYIPGGESPGGNIIQSEA